MNDAFVFGFMVARNNVTNARQRMIIYDPRSRTQLLSQQPDSQYTFVTEMHIIAQYVHVIYERNMHF